MISKFLHTPLEDGFIRLITILPGEGSIEISFHQKAFSAAGDYGYEALSYTWGNTHKLEYEVEVNPNATSQRQPTDNDFASYPERRIMKVGENLYFALRDLRGEAPRVLWIDALCIDQENHIEKSREVTKMGNIYKFANRVIIWLGPCNGNDSSAKALATLSRLGQQVSWDSTTKEMLPANPCEVGCEYWFHSTCVLPYDEATWRSIGNIFSKPWFRRVWIWQEVGLANQDQALLKYGQTSISWKHFAAAAAAIGEKSESGPKDDKQQGLEFEKHLAIIKQIVTQNTKNTMCSLLDATRESECSDARDRIYAMLDLASGGRKIGISPNYAHTDLEVYRDFMIRDCTVKKNLNILQYCGVETWSKGFPSWVPNWPKPQLSQTRLGSHASSFEGPFQALDDDMALAVKGIICGTISHISTATPLSKHGPITDAVFRSWLAGSNFESKTIIGGLDALVNVLTNWKLRDRYPQEVDWASQEETRLVLSQIREMRPYNSLPRAANAKDNLKRFARGRALFKTEKNRIGLAPSQASSGDIVFAILGCTTLLVLRRQSNDRYRVVGPCNLHGFMDLEALFGPVPDNFYVEEGAILHMAYDMWFVDAKTGEKSRTDPRVGTGPPGWRYEGRDEDECVIWENIETGTRTFHDPRLTDIDFLTERNIDVQEIVLE
ncbi:hypothetical protein N431DRAFT_427408 [Stipitochalara longipes BDJ]|nr:hypothetical protein N431DRAFT_427408 [Stipitochalara longipes BDJ]